MSDNSSCKILIVDDDENLLDSLRRQLRGGYDCTFMNDPAAALEVIEQHQETYTVVISDLYMPTMDGLQFLRQIRQVCPESVCMILTGGHDQQVAVRALNEGEVFRYLQKPCTADDLKQSIDNAIQEHRRLVSKKTFVYRMEFTDTMLSHASFGPGCFAVTGRQGGDFEQELGLWQSMIVDEDRSVIEEFLSQIYSNRTADPAEFRICRPDRQVRWIRNTIFSQHFSPGSTVCRIEGLMEDVTEKKDMEEALDRANRRYEKIVENVPGVVFQFRLQLDGTLRFVFISPSCRQMFALEPGDICEDSELLLERFLPSDLARLYKMIAESAQSQGSFTWQGCLLDEGAKGWYQAMAKPERLVDGQVLWDGVLMDITEMKEAEQRVTFLAKFPSENPNPVLRVDRDGVIHYANEASERLLNVWERTVGQQVPEDFLGSVQRVLESEKDETIEIECKGQYFAIVVAPVSRDQAVNLYARDVTSVKNAELGLIEANQKLIDHDKMKSEFVSTVSHELRTPLCIFKNILSNAMAGVSGPITPKLRENLEMAQTSVERLTRIISDFLDISKIEAGQMKLDREVCFMQDLVSEVAKSLKPLAQAKKISIAMNIPKTPVFSEVDRDKITQVLINIVGNAIKFIPVRGDIYVNMTDYLQTDYFDVCVRDNGPGMSRQEVEKIFDRFVQAKILKGPGEHGTGLGLSIAKEIIQLHGGRIWAESEPGKGCAFYFRLNKYVKTPKASDVKAGQVNIK
jgi:signal transduction histidine kinase/CheY-like chemotaxis protein